MRMYLIQCLIPERVLATVLGQLPKIAAVSALVLHSSRAAGFCSNCCLQMKLWQVTYGVQQWRGLIDSSAF